MGLAKWSAKKQAMSAMFCDQGSRDKEEEKSS
jgi:hypothetical protein